MYTPRRAVQKKPQRRFRNLALNGDGPHHRECEARPKEINKEAIAVDRTQQIQGIYKELDQIQTEIRPFIIPQSANIPKLWTSNDLERYAALQKRLDEIILQLSEFEDGTV